MKTFYAEKTASLNFLGQTWELFPFSSPTCRRRCCDDEKGKTKISRGIDFATFLNLRVLAFYGSAVFEFYKIKIRRTKEINNYNFISLQTFLSLLFSLPFPFLLSFHFRDESYSTLLAMRIAMSRVSIFPSSSASAVSETRVSVFSGPGDPHSSNERMYCIGI